MILLQAFYFQLYGILQKIKSIFLQTFSFLSLHLLSNRICYWSLNKLFIFFIIKKNKIKNLNKIFLEDSMLSIIAVLTGPLAYETIRFEAVHIVPLTEPIIIDFFLNID